MDILNTIIIWLISGSCITMIFLYMKKLKYLEKRCTTKCYKVMRDESNILLNRWHEKERLEQKKENELFDIEFQVNMEKFIKNDYINYMIIMLAITKYDLSFYDILTFTNKLVAWEVGILLIYFVWYEKPHNKRYRMVPRMPDPQWLNEQIL